MKTSLWQVNNSGPVPPDDRVGRFTSGHGSFRGELSVMAFLEPAQTFSTFIHKCGFSPSRSWLPLSSFVILSIIYATLSKKRNKRFSTNQLPVLLRLQAEKSKDSTHHHLCPPGIPGAPTGARGAGRCEHARLCSRSRLRALPRRVVLSTTALSNELQSSLPATAASSLTWWRRWGHAGAALYPQKPTQVSRLLILSGNFSAAGSGEACQGQLHIVTPVEKNNLFFRRTGVEIR